MRKSEDCYIPSEYYRADTLIMFVKYCNALMVKHKKESIEIYNAINSVKTKVIRLCKKNPNVIPKTDKLDAVMLPIGESPSTWLKTELSKKLEENVINSITF